VLSYFSSRRNWDSPTPSPAGECAPLPLVPGGGAHSLAREGLGESQFRRGDLHCGTLYMCVLCVPDVLRQDLDHGKDDISSQRLRVNVHFFNFMKAETG
jgi:hypothetical protein